MWALRIFCSNSPVILPLAFPAPDVGEEEVVVVRAEGGMGENEGPLSQILFIPPKDWVQTPTRAAELQEHTPISFFLSTSLCTVT